MEATKFFIDDASPVPVYAQLCEQVQAAVAHGTLDRGAQLPSIRDVAAALSLNPNTVNRAYAQLERDGIIEVRRGLGTFVTGSRPKVGAGKALQLVEIAGRFVDRARALGYGDPQIVRAVHGSLEKRRRSNG